MSEKDEDGDEVLDPTPLYELPDINEVLSDPGKFVAGMTELTIYSVFVPLSPVAAMAKWADQPVSVTPYTLCGVDGCLIGTPSADFYEALLSEFHCDGPS